MFLVIGFLGVPIGMNLHANNVDMLTPTKKSAGTLVKGTFESGIELVGGNVGQIQKSIKEQSGKPAKTDQTGQPSNDQKNPEEDSNN